MFSGQAGQDMAGRLHPTLISAVPLQNGASNQNSLQQQQQGSDLNGVPAQAMQNMQFGPLENSSGMLSALPVHVRLLPSACTSISYALACM